MIEGWFHLVPSHDFSAPSKSNAPGRPLPAPVAFACFLYIHPHSCSVVCLCSVICPCDVCHPHSVIHPCSVNHPQTIGQHSCYFDLSWLKSQLFWQRAVIKIIHLIQSPNHPSALLVKFSVLAWWLKDDLPSWKTRWLLMLKYKLNNVMGLSISSQLLLEMGVEGMFEKRYTEDDSTKMHGIIFCLILLINFTSTVYFIVVACYLSQSIC